MNDTTFQKAKPGDRIYSMVHGEMLTVKHIVRAMSGKWYIQFVDGPTCTMDGKHYNDKGMQTYFWDRPKVVAPVKPVHVPGNDALVEVRNSDGVWMKRYSTGRTSDGILWCWDNGRTSLSAEHEDHCSPWKHWKECKV